LSEILRFCKQFLVQLAHICSFLPGAEVPVIWNMEGEDTFSREKEPPFADLQDWSAALAKQGLRVGVTLYLPHDSE